MYTNYKLILDAKCVSGNRIEVAKIFATSMISAETIAEKKMLNLLAGPALKWLSDVRIEKGDYWTKVIGIPKDIIPEEYKNAYFGGEIRFIVIENIPYWRGKSVIENYCTYDGFHNVSTYCDIRIPKSWIKLDSWSKDHGPRIQVQGGSYLYNSDIYDLYYVGGNTYAKVIFHDDNLPGSIVNREDAEIRYFQR